MLNLEILYRSNVDVSICGEEENVFISFILNVFLSNGYNIYFIVIFKLSSTMVRCDCGTFDYQ